jgi:hypothetical protein
MGLTNKLWVKTYNFLMLQQLARVVTNGVKKLIKFNYITQ